MKVTAKDQATGRSQHITITASSGLSKDEVERMRQEAESHAEEDRVRREKIEVRNQGDNSIYAAEKALREFGDKIPPEMKTEIEAAVAESRKALESDDVDAMRKANETLGQVIQKIGGAMYGQGNPAPPEDDKTGTAEEEAGPAESTEPR
jgi:molecular chaperone DnaK